MPPCRSKEKLPNVHCPAGYVASHEVRIHSLKICGRKHPPRQDTFAKAGSETLDLIFQFVEHVHFAPIRHMTIGPCRMFTHRSARTIEQTRLSQQNERSVRVVSHSDRLFRSSNLLEASAKMYCRCAQTVGSLPRDGSAQRVIHFEGTGAITKFSKLPPVPVS